MFSYLYKYISNDTKLLKLFIIIITVLKRFIFDKHSKPDEGEEFSITSKDRGLKVA